MDDSDFGKMCDRCKCCELIRESCETCGGEGIVGHDCGEDTCCCLDPEDNIECQWCEGEGGWWTCTCDENGVHHCSHCKGEGHTYLTCPQRPKAAAVTAGAVEGDTANREGTDDR